MVVITTTTAREVSAPRSLESKTLTISPSSFGGTDTTTVGLSTLLQAYLGIDVGDDIDAQDTQQNLAMGPGERSLTQARDAIDLTRALLAEVASIPNATVTVTGQSLGGGLAGIVSAVLDLPGFIIAPAPFKNQLRFEARREAIIELQENAVSGASGRRIVFRARNIKRGQLVCPACVSREQLFDGSPRRFSGQVSGAGRSL